MARCCRHGCTAADRHAYKVPNSANLEARKSLLRKAWEGIQEDVEARIETTLRQDLFICHDHFVQGTFKFTGTADYIQYYTRVLEILHVKVAEQTHTLCRTVAKNVHIGLASMNQCVGGFGPSETAIRFTVIGYA